MQYSDIKLDVVSEAGWRKTTITSGMVEGETSLFTLDGIEVMSLPVSRGWNIVVVDRAAGTLTDSAVSLNIACMHLYTDIAR